MCYINNGREGAIFYSSTNSLGVYLPHPFPLKVISESVVSIYYSWQQSSTVEERSGGSDGHMSKFQKSPSFFKYMILQLDEENEATHYLLIC